MNDDRRDLAVSLYRRLLEAWNARDPGAFAALFAEDGSTVGFDGSMLNGSAEIASALRGTFASHPTAAYVAKVREVRELGPDVTLVRAVAGMIPPGKDELNPAVNAVQSMILIARYDARRRGKKQNPLDYDECFGDAAQEALAHLLSSPELQVALEKGRHRLERRRPRPSGRRRNPLERGRAVS